MDDLRKRAQNRLKQAVSEQAVPSSLDLYRAVEELQIHKIELELQNQELKRAFNDLEESSRLFYNLYEASPVGYCSLDEHGLIHRINRTGSDILRQERRRLIGQRFSILVGDPWLGTFSRHIRQSLLSRERHTCELGLMHKDSSVPTYVQIVSTVLSNIQDQQRQIHSAIIDITGRKFAEERILSLSRELILAQEKERRLISCDLHDRVAQDLSTLKMGVDSLLNDWGDAPVQLRTRTEALSRMLTNVIASVRDLSYELIPPDLTGRDLPSCLFSLCQDFAGKTGIAVEFFSAGTDRVSLDPLARLHVYRIVQEGLTNIQRHSAATRATVTFSLTYPNITLRISDNGRGFDPERRLREAVSETRMGLRSLEERAKLLGGNLDLQSRPMYGTWIQIRFPAGGNYHE